MPKRCNADHPPAAAGRCSGDSTARCRMQAWGRRRGQPAGTGCLGLPEGSSTRARMPMTHDLCLCACRPVIVVGVQFVFAPHAWHVHMRMHTGTLAPHCNGSWGTGDACIEGVHIIKPTQSFVRYGGCAHHQTNPIICTTWRVRTSSNLVSHLRKCRGPPWSEVSPNLSPTLLCLHAHTAPTHISAQPSDVGGHPLEKQLVCAAES